MSKIKTLIVDDSKIMHSSVKRILNQLLLTDFEYVEAIDGEDALENYSDDIQIVFFDWNMLRMTGVEFIKSPADNKETPNTVMIMTENDGQGGHCAQRGWRQRLSSQVLNRAIAF